MPNKQPSLETIAIHLFENPKPFGAVRPPLYDTTTFSFKDIQSLNDAIGSGNTHPFYTRYGSNPGILATEKKLAKLDHADDALLFSAGMAALSALFIAHGKNGILCIGEVYGGTHTLLAQQLTSLGISSHFMQYDQIPELISQSCIKYGLVFFETPANPTLNIIDISTITSWAHQQGMLVAVDNTFASPINQQPIKLGVDLCVQSATKYLGGHSDLTAGVITGNKPVLDIIRPWRTSLGQICSPATAHLLDRSLATLPLRVACHNDNAMAIASWLESHPQVIRVNYPGLPNFPDHAIAKKQMTGFGGMLSFEIKGNGKDTIQFINNLNLFSRAPSLGGVESLVSQPSKTSHRHLTFEEKKKKRIQDNLIRLSIGLENHQDLLDDLELAFNL
ncbi:MAG: aminotransferase class I/II-fold pyridoxal phosphate-dependent enzyme [Proteobacteria bacterium]|nr:aminotransferase class I/II-fold pyridoxal phosphate-dependent enzyme [Pseudomonadota bacterium]